MRHDSNDARRFTFSKPPHGADFQRREHGAAVAFPKKMVGAPGFEPGTSRTPSVRATRLRYAPTYFVRLSPAFEKGQESAQRIAHIQQHFAVQKLRCPVARRNGCARFRFSRSPALAQVPAGTRNRESFVIKQAFDFPN